MLRNGSGCCLRSAQTWTCVDALQMQMRTPRRHGALPDNIIDKYASHRHLHSLDAELPQSLDRESRPHSNWTVFDLYVLQTLSLTLKGSALSKDVKPPQQ